VEIPGFPPLSRRARAQPPVRHWLAPAAVGVVLLVAGCFPGGSSGPTVQVDMAWVLYQWQGKAPWAGSGC